MTKIHAVVDGPSNPVYIQLTGGNVQDCSMAVDILDHMDISNSTILADKAYGTKEIWDYTQQQDGDDVIPPNPIHEIRGTVTGFFTKNPI